MIGAGFWLLLGERLVESLSRYPRPRSASTSQIVWLLQAYVLGLTIFSVIPLDLTISVTELYNKNISGVILVVPFTYSYDAISTVVYQFFADVITFAPVGTWLAFTNWHRRLAPTPLVGALVGGAAIAAVIEFAQLLVISRFTDVTDILLGTIGAGLGAWVVEHPARLVTVPTASTSLTWSPASDVLNACCRG